MPEMSRKEQDRKIAANQNTPEIPAENAAFSGVSDIQAMGDAGLEPATSWV
jgi:hypothetical protein